MLNAARRFAASPQLLAWTDGVLFDALPARRSDLRWHVLISPPGGGNIGDQAMVEAYLDNVDGEVVVIVRQRSDVEIPERHRSRVRIAELRGLIYSSLPRHMAHMWSYRNLLRHARSVALIGADIMDGGYNAAASANRANLLLLARRAGVPARVLGFSWNAKPAPEAIAALRQASHAGVKLLVRDPHSAERARRDGLANVVESADLVFCAQDVDHENARKLLAHVPADAPLALVNASGLIGNAVDQIQEYLTLIAHLRRQGLQVVLLPHVSRPGADDLPICRQLHAQLNDPGVGLIDRILPPVMIRGLTARATLVITGRMHLAIMSFYNTVPAITLATQGKVEGLMQLFETDRLCVEPTAGFGNRINAIVDELLNRPEEVRATIARNLPRVRQRSALNFEAPAAATLSA